MYRQRRGKRQGGLQATAWGADALVEGGKGGGGEGLTSGGVRKGEGVSESTLMRPLGHTR